MLNYTAFLHTAEMANVDGIYYDTLLQLMGKNVDENLVAELTSSNCAVFEMLLDSVHGRDSLTSEDVIDLLHKIGKDKTSASNAPKMFSLDLLAASNETNKETEAAATEHGQTNYKRTRVSDVDMFSTDIVEEQRMSGDTTGGLTHVPAELELVSPSPLSCSTSVHIHNTSVASVPLKTASQMENAERDADEEMVDEVEPNVVYADNPQLPYQHSSSCHAVVTTDDSSGVAGTGVLSECVNICDEMLVNQEQKEPESSLAPNVDALLPENQNPLPTQESPSDNGACVKAATDTVVEKNSEVVGDLVTSSSCLDESLHSCVLDTSLSSTVDDYQQPVSCRTAATTAFTDWQLVQLAASVPTQQSDSDEQFGSALNESHVSDSDAQSQLGGSRQSLRVLPSSYSFDQVEDCCTCSVASPARAGQLSFQSSSKRCWSGAFDTLYGMDSETRRLLIPPIERLLRPSSVQRSCIIKLYRSQRLDTCDKDGQIVKMYS